MELVILLKLQDWKKTGQAFVRLWSNGRAAAMVSPVCDWFVFLPEHLDAKLESNLLNGSADNIENAKLAVDEKLNELCLKYSEKSTFVGEPNKVEKEIKIIKLPIIQ